MSQKKKKEEFKDDNRTIANMDVLDGTRWHNAIGHNPSKVAGKPKEPEKLPAELSGMPPPEPIQLTKKERRAMKKAAFGFAFKLALMALGILLVTFLLVWLWLH